MKFRLKRLPSLPALLLPLLLVACASVPHVERPVTADELRWLDRIGFGLDSQLLQQYRTLGRQRFLDAQLSNAPDRDADFFPGVAARIHSGESGNTDIASLLSAVRSENQAIKDITDPEARQALRQKRNQQGNEWSFNANQELMLRQLYSSRQLRERMEWFWLNHFNVYAGKDSIRWLLGDYADRAVRPHVFGHFRDLVLATLEHPAMLQYLDNRQNAVGRINENYARELMELHTLGVDAGYTQKDVSELARVLTGVGIRAGDQDPRLRPQWRRFYVRRGAFEFNPARHDFGPKVLLGQRLRGSGMAEVEEAVDVLVRQPACARFISRKLATYFLGDDAPPSLVQAMSQTFQRTHGDIADTVRVLLAAPEMSAPGGRFKDPQLFVVSALRFAYDGQPLNDLRPALNALAQLGEGPFGHQTPEGYPQRQLDWAGPGQMTQRFELARALGSGKLGPAVPQMSGPLYRIFLEPGLLPGTRAALGAARSAMEWNALLLSSPDFNHL